MTTKKKRIYIHIGTPKTGTTSIQEYLALNDQALYEEGFLVPKTSRRHKGNHTLFTNYCINRSQITAISIRNGIYTKKELAKFRRDFYTNLRKEISTFPGHSVVISNEQCYGRLTEPAEIQKLKALFDGIAESIQIIVYLREQTDMLCSFYSSQVKNAKTHTIETLEQFRASELFDYYKKLTPWEEVFGLKNVSLRIFDKEKLAGGDAISDFCTLLGMPFYDTRPERLNETLNAKQCEYLRLANYYLPFFYEGRVNPMRSGLVRLLEATSIQSPPVPALITKAYQDVYDESNKCLAEKYGMDKEALFAKRPLNEEAIDQTTLLSGEDKKDITRQILKNAGEEHEALCKCLACLFDVEYKGDKLPRAFIEPFYYDSKAKKTLISKLRSFIR